ncbi:hypothetical protein [Rahnella inusitata]|uniref:hypothetical protein n=1 Tax=Rahnella inusitata TaxID=58169 RepID=UPI0039AFC90B
MVNKSKLISTLFITSITLPFMLCAKENYESSVVALVDKGICSININNVEAAKYPCLNSDAPTLISFSDLYEVDTKVFIFIDNPRGNACDGGPIHVFSQNNDGKYLLHEEIDFCGGHHPSITSSATKLSINIPSMDIDGTVLKIPAEQWVFENNVLTKAR